MSFPYKWDFRWDSLHSVGIEAGKRGLGTVVIMLEFLPYCRWAYKPNAWIRASFLLMSPQFSLPFYLPQNYGAIYFFFFLLNPHRSQMPSSHVYWNLERTENYIDWYLCSFPVRFKDPYIHPCCDYQDKVLIFWNSGSVLGDLFPLVSMTTCEVVCWYPLMW